MNRFFMIVILLMSVLLIASCGGVTESTTAPPTTTTTTTAPTTTTTPITTTTTTPIVATTQATTTPTSTTAANNEPIAYLVLDLLLPPYGHPDDFTSISIIVTNTGSSRGSCDIPITFTEVGAPGSPITYVISVTLDPGETKEVTFDKVFLKEATYTAEVGDISLPFKVQ